MKNLISLLTCCLALPTFHALADECDVLGIWTTADDRSRIEIFKKQDTYCGKVIWLKQPNFSADDKRGMGGKPQVDRENPKPGLRSRPLVGLEIMSGLAYAGKNQWHGGKVYDPESGKTYKCHMTLTATNRLELRGFIGISLLGRTEVWTR
jgi:uncharacterized protein (DUF2147 family)